MTQVPDLETLLADVVAEEAVAAGQVPDVGGDGFWPVGPLDGTEEFVHRNGEFTVNVALIDGGRPVFGEVLAPALGHGAWAEEDGQRRPIVCRAVPAEGPTVVASRSHGDAAALDVFLADRPVARLVNAGSSLKRCVVAAGEADVYPQLGRTMDWDIAAGHAVLAAAGGDVRSLQGAVLGYGKPGFENPPFVAFGAAVH